ncbi:hypothetical protein BVY03_02535 [bacterium K02(2017)]|nr:hypothetical protein BVY03_02535 [bacterium K02(2017)]
MPEIKVINRYLWIIIISSLATYIFTWFFTETLPKSDMIDPIIFTEPTQEPTDAEPFIKEFEDKKYMIRPQYQYDIYGLIVSYQDLDEKWFNIYYENDPYNIKDLCIIWGDNVKDDDYTQVEYWSGTWTCYFRWYENKINFDHQKLSNNHILPDNPEVAQVLKNAKRGDQVHFEGYLVNYSILGNGGSERSSSITRTDTGNHACEVVYVKNFEIIQSYNNYWRLFNSLSFGLMLLAFGLKTYTFFFL